MSDRRVAARPARRRHADRGVSLVGLLVAVVVTGIVVASLAGLTMVIFRQQGGTGSRLDLTRAEQSLGMWLPNDLASADSVDSLPAATPCGSACPIAGPGSVFFASGIYAFTNSVTISGDVDVVVGDGAVQGCATDFEAATYAVDAPPQHGISGTGATFLFGQSGRLVVHSPLASGTLRVRFNQRYVSDTALATDSSAVISMMSVNGAIDGNNAWVDLAVPGVLSVPKSTLQGVQTNVLAPSTMVAQNPLPPGAAIVDLDLSGAQAGQVEVAGYVVVPQGAVSIATAAATKANKTVRFNAGAAAAMFALGADRPGTFVLDIVNPIVRKTFRIVSTATSGPPVTSTAVVIVNQNGAYAIRSWTVQ